MRGVAGIGIERGLVFELHDAAEGVSPGMGGEVGADVGLKEVLVTTECLHLPDMPSSATESNSAQEYTAVLSHPQSKPASRGLEVDQKHHPAGGGVRCLPKHYWRVAGHAFATDKLARPGNKVIQACFSFLALSPTEGRP